MFTALYNLPPIDEEGENEINGALKPESDVFELYFPKASPHAVYLDKAIDSECGREGIRDNLPEGRNGCAWPRDA